MSIAYIVLSLLGVFLLISGLIYTTLDMLKVSKKRKRFRISFILYAVIVFGGTFLSRQLPYQQDFRIFFPITFLVLIIPTFFTFAIVYWLTKRRIKNKRFPKVLLLLFGISCIYSIHNQQFNTKIVNYEIFSNKITQEQTIVMISDLHLTPFNDHKFLQKIHGQLSDINPDFVLIAGDVFDDCDGFDENIMKVFSTFSRKTYIVPGNHDQYGGVDCISQKFKDIDNNNLIRLQDENIKHNKDINIIGFDDPGRETFINMDLFNNISDDDFNLVLIHQPVRVEEISKNNIDLMVAGHTHQGQVFPFSLFIKLLYKYDYGQYLISKMNLIVSSGVGFRGAPIRLGTNSEIVVIKVIPE